MFIFVNILGFCWFL